MQGVAVSRQIALAAVAVLGWSAASWASAAEPSQQSSGSHISGLRTEPDLPMPSPARVIVVVVVTLGLAAGTLILVRRYLPRFIPRTDAGMPAIKVITRASLSRSLQLHVVEFETRRVLIVEGRSGIELAVLPSSEGGGPQRSA
jgi:hypothetical protein